MLEFLEVLLSDARKADEKKRILEEKFHMPMTTEMNEEVHNVGSLGQQIREDAWQEGVEIGRSQGVEQGIEIGKNQGIEIGKNQGIEIGKNQGIEIGKNRGIEIGKLNALAQLVKQNTVPMEVAAGIMNMSVETFQRKISGLVL